MKFVILSLTILLLVGCGPMMSTTTTIISERISPDGKYVATAFTTDAGATTSWSPQVDVRPVGQHIDRRGNVFVGYGSPTIDTEWLSSSNLVIYIDPKFEVDLYLSNFHGIKIDKLRPK